MNLKHKLIKKLRKEFPQVKFKTAELVTQGWDHDVLVLDGKFIFRFAKEKLYKNSFAREVKFLKAFSKISNLKVPNYTYFSKDKSFGGYEMIHGQPLSQRVYKGLSPAKKQKFIGEIAKFLTILHKIPLRQAAAYGFKKYNAWTENQKWFKTEFEPKVYKKLSPKQRAFIKNFTSTFYKSSQTIQPVLGHFDLSHDHILVNKAEDIAGIIDFGDVNLSDPAREFNGFFDFDKKLAAAVYKFYRGPKDPGFLKRARDHEVHRWIYLLYDGLIRRKDKALWEAANQEINRTIRTYPRWCLMLMS